MIEISIDELEPKLSDIGDMNNPLLNPIYQSQIISLWNPSRGDVLHLMEVGDYRNDGKVIWDGEKVVDLAYDIDDYGHLPDTFFVGDEFHADYWVNDIDHNSIVWINLTKHRNELLANLKPTHTEFTTDLGTFTIKIRSHSLYMGRKALKKLLRSSKDAIYFDVIDKYTMSYTYTFDDELEELYPGKSFSGIGASGAYFNVIIGRENIYIQYEHDEHFIVSHKEYERLMK